MRSTETYGPEKIAFSVKEAASLLSLGRTSLYLHVQSGRLRPTKCGRRTLFLATDITAFLAALQEGGRR